MFKNAVVNKSITQCGAVMFFAALLLAPAQASQAADDLLDPGKIGSAKKSVATEGLLDPGHLAALSLPSNGPSSKLHRANHQAPSYARGMAASVVSSLDTLTREAADMSDEMIRIDQQAGEFGDKLKILQEEKEHKLGEYRSGLFCSGCNKTKSEILAMGEQFPHQGQAIVRPTPEQVANKERELQLPIDQLEHDLKENQTRRAKALKERNEALAQIGYGLDLWRTSLTFESVLLALDEKDSSATYKAERAKAEDQLAKLRPEISQKEREVGAIPALTAESFRLTDRLDELGAAILANDNDRANAKMQHEKLRLEMEQTTDPDKRSELANAKSQLKENLSDYAAKAAQHKAEQAKVGSRLAQVKAQLKKANESKAKLDELKNDFAMWTAMLDQLDEKRVNDHQANNDAIARAAAAADREHVLLDGYVARGKLPTLLKVSTSVSAGPGANALGGLYRMGNHDAARHGEELVSVDGFIKAYRNSSR